MRGGDSAVNYVTFIYIFVYTNKSGIVGLLVIASAQRKGMVQAGKAEQADSRDPAVSLSGPSYFALIPLQRYVIYD